MGVNRASALGGIGLLLLSGCYISFTGLFTQPAPAELPSLESVRATSTRIQLLQQQLEAANARADKAEAILAKTGLNTPTQSSCPPSSTEDGATLGEWEQTADNKRLNALLKQVANPRREVLLALANDVMMCTNRKTCWWNGGNVLETFLKSLRRLKLRNFVIISLDDATHAFCEKFGGVTSLRLELPVPTAQQGSRGANMISTLKYGLLRQVLLMAYSVLVVDLDLVFLKDPFDHLHRDADLEASTDGFSSSWAGGQISSVHEPKMGWGAGGLFIKHFTLNVGCAYFRPTTASIALMARVSSRLSQAAAWDQQVFNQEVFMLSHGAYKGSMVKVRVMRYDEWMNSKVFFFSDRRLHFPGKSIPQSQWPVMIHMNYHADKHKRMLCVYDRFIEGRVSACDSFPEGS